MAKYTKEIIGGSAIVIASIIATLSTCNSCKNAKAEPTQSVKVDSGSVVVAGKNIIQQGGKNVIAGGNATVYYGDTNKGKQVKSGETYITKSVNQKGGLTVGKIELYNLTVIAPDKYKDSLSSPDNYKFHVDSIHKIISVQPKYGSWTQTFLGIAKSEKPKVQPHFMNSIRDIRSMKTDSILFQGDSLYFITTNADPASKEISYSVHYVTLPQYLVFGNFPYPLYKATLR